MFKFISTLSAAVLVGVVVASPAMAQQTGNQASKPVEATLSVFQVGKSAEGKVEINLNMITFAGIES